MITPMAIHNKEFEKGFRGYDSDAVDAFLAELVRDYETLYRDNREMTDKIEQLEKRLAQYEQMEATMNNTLVLEVSEVPATLDERHAAAGHTETDSKDDMLAAAIMKQAAGEV